MDTMIHIGAVKETVTEAKVAIMDILTCSASDQLKLAAFDALTRVCSVNGTTISNCTITNTEKE